jgi:hypothetical protein
MKLKSKRKVTIQEDRPRTEALSTNGSRSTEAESTDTPCIKNIRSRRRLAEMEGAGDDESFAVGQGIYHGAQSPPSLRETVDSKSPCLNPPKSPRMSMDLDEEAKSILAPPRSTISDRGGSLDRRHKDKKTTKQSIRGTYSSASSSSSESADVQAGVEYYSEESFDEEDEEYCSPDEGGYVSPNPRDRYALPDASEYVSPIESPDRGTVSVSLDDARRGARLQPHDHQYDHRPTSTASAHSRESSYEEVVLSDSSSDGD